MKAILTLIKSKNNPVFETPMEIEYEDNPTLKESFQFTASRYGNCWTSTIQSINKLSTSILEIITRNSTYHITLSTPSPDELACDGTTHYTGCKCHEATWQMRLDAAQANLKAAIAIADQYEDQRDEAESQRDALSIENAGLRDVVKNLIIVAEGYIDLSQRIKDGGLGGSTHEKIKSLVQEYISRAK